MDAAVSALTPAADSRWIRAVALSLIGLLAAWSWLFVVSKWGPAVDSMKVELMSAGVPQGATLAFARITPDPVREGARLGFTLAAAGDARLAVYDIQGRERAQLVDGTLGAGPHTVDFSPRSRGLGPGLYLAVLQAGAHTLVRRFTVLD